MYKWLGAEIAFVHVGHGLLGATVVVILALHLPWWFTLALAPLLVFSLWIWFKEASLVMPVARRYLSANPFPATGTATTRPGGAAPAIRDGASGQTTAETFTIRSKGRR
jgi:hypothetical protein